MITYSPATRAQAGQASTVDENDPMKESVPYMRGLDTDRVERGMVAARGGAYGESWGVGVHKTGSHSSGIKVLEGDGADHQYCHAVSQLVIFMAKVT